MHSHVPSGKGKTVIMDRNLRATINNFCMLNEDVMGKWVNIYHEAKAKMEEERKAWKRAHGGRRAPPYPRELAKLPDLIDVEWIHDAMCKAKTQGQQITNKEWEYARGCLPKVLYAFFEFNKL